MTIKKRGSVFWMSFTVNGERVRESCGTDDKKLAQELHDKRRAEVWRERKLGEKPKKTWDDAAAQWEREKAHKRTIQQDLDKFAILKPKIGSMLLTDINRELVSELVEDFKTPATKNRHVALIRSVLRAAEREWLWLDHAPALKTYAENNKRKVRASKEQMDKLLAVLPEEYHGQFRFALLTGLRKSNVFGLRWEWVNLKARTVWIEPEHAKAGERITVPLSQSAVDLIAAQQGKHADFVFGEADSVPRKAWARCVKLAGLPAGFRWHDLRHVWASWHLDTGTSKSELMELGGWKTPSMVDRYATPATEALIQRADSIGTFLTQSAPESQRLAA